MATGTDSQVVATTTLDNVLLLLVCLAGLAAFAVQWLLGRDATDLLALMVVGTAGLLWNLNLRIVAVLRRQRRRKGGNEE